MLSEGVLLKVFGRWEEAAAVRTLEESVSFPSMILKGLETMKQLARLAFLDAK